MVNGTKMPDEKARGASIKEAINSGKAYEKFKIMVENQHGDLRFVKEPELFRNSQFVIPVFASESGYVESIDADIVGSIAVYLGAGRMKNITNSFPAKQTGYIRSDSPPLAAPVPVGRCALLHRE